MLNNCLLTGNLGADPEVFYSSEGDPIATFNLVFRPSKKKYQLDQGHLLQQARCGMNGTLLQC